MNNSFGFGGTNSTLIFRQYFPFWSKNFFKFFYYQS
jgi:hypothetical protein